MVHILKKENWFLVSRGLFAVLFLFLISRYTGTEAQLVSQPLHGWAWSSNVGWVSMNCEDRGVCGSSNYRVEQDATTGDISGYAWSSNIGWVHFNPSGPYPEVPNISVSAPPAGGTLTGWARACSVFESNCSGTLKLNTRRGGWDGWIKMSGSPTSGDSYGVTYNVAGGSYAGFAWGSDVIGWLNFDQVTTIMPDNLAVSLTADPVSGVAPLEVDLTATINTGAVGSEADYYFWWNCSDVTTDVDMAKGSCGDPADPDIGSIFFAESALQKIETHTYLSPGMFMPKVIVVNADRSAQGTATVDISLPSRANLIIKENSIGVKSGNLEKGQTVTFKGVVENAGGADVANPFKNRFQIDFNSTSFTTADITRNADDIASLATLDTRQVDSDANPWVITTDGTHTLRLCADYQNVITDEESEADNCRDKIIVVLAPDLVARNLIVPASINQGDTLQFKGSVHNDGNGAVNTAFQNIFTINGTSVGVRSVVSLNTGSQKQLTSDAWLASTPGNYTLRFCTDSNNNVDEATGKDSQTDGDNCISQVFTVAAVAGPGSFDLTKSNDIQVSFSPARFSESTDTTITVTNVIGAIGNVTFSVEDVLDNNGIVISDLLYDGNFNPPTISSGGQTQFSLDVSRALADSSADKNFVVIVRGDSASGANNTISIALTIKASGPGFGEQ